MSLDNSLEVADVLRSHGVEYLNLHGKNTSSQQRRVMRDLMNCRTSALGGHVQECDACGHRVISYNSCRNRHCPKCQGNARAKWLEKQSANLLQVEYFHVVFTVPESLNPLVLANRRLVYGVLFQAAAQTLTSVAADSKHLGAEIGFLAVLHTWGQTMCLHPHVHCVVPGGGLSFERDRWVSCRPGFFLPVRVLSRVFRGKFLALLERAYERGKVVIPGQGPGTSREKWFRDKLKQLMQTDWVVYAKPPFGGPEQVLKYLARYTHRVAISNRRLVKLKDGQVSFTWKDYASRHEEKVMVLDAVEFIRRFLLHVLPSGFMHIRQYGFLANRNREEKLALCRRLIQAIAEADGSSEANGTPIKPAKEASEGAKEETNKCPVCGRGVMVRIELLPAPEITHREQTETESQPQDTS